MSVLRIFSRQFDNIANFGNSDAGVVAAGRADMHNDNNEKTMVTTRIGTHTVLMYDAIDELPIVRFHKYQKLLLIDAGVGSDIAAFDQRLEKARGFIAQGQSEQAIKELDNLRQTVFLMQNEVSLKSRAFAVLVKQIDGKIYDDLSDEGIAKVLERLQDAPNRHITAALAAVKKKIDAELKIYFPAIFNTSEVKEYFDLLKARTVKILECVAAGTTESAEVERLTLALITYFKPQSFEGRESAEIAFDRQFENLCLVLSEQLHVEPKKYTVLEFYNAFDFVQEKAKALRKAQKRPNFGR